MHPLNAEDKIWYDQYRNHTLRISDEKGNNADKKDIKQRESKAVNQFPMSRGRRLYIIKRLKYRHLLIFAQ